MALLAVGFVAACGNNSGDDIGADASNDVTVDVKVDAKRATKDATPDATKDAMPDVAADSAPDAAPDAASDTANDTASEAASDAGKDAAKDAPLETSTGDAGGCGSSTDCLSTEYCDKAFGDCAGRGVCKTISSFCPTFCSNTCGCDRVTYCNSCYAAKNGRTSIAYNGACE